MKVDKRRGYEICRLRRDEDEDEDEDDDNNEDDEKGHAVARLTIPPTKTIPVRQKLANPRALVRRRTQSSAVPVLARQPILGLAPVMVLVLLRVVMMTMMLLWWGRERRMTMVTGMMLGIVGRMGLDLMLVLEPAL